MTFVPKMTSNFWGHCYLSVKSIKKKFAKCFLYNNEACVNCVGLNITK